MSSAVRAHRNAIFALFFVPGFAMASWVTRTPDVRDLLGASAAEMGLVFFGLSVGSMAGILLATPVALRVGTRPNILVGLCVAVAAVALIGFAAALGSALLTALALAVFGFGMGAADVAVNIDGAEVERRLERSVMPAMHGFYSLGTVVGGALGLAATALSLSVELHLLAVSVMALGIVLVALRGVPAGTGRASGARTGSNARPPAIWRDGKLLLIGIVILALALAEGAANDWLPLLMVDGHGVSAALASAAFVMFAAAMTLGRFIGGWFVDRYGRATVLAVSASIAALGIGIVIFIDHPIVAVGAVVLWGLGAALGFPLALSAAGASGVSADDTARRMAFAATLGYIAFLVGPPALGFLGEEFGLRAAMIAVLALVVVAIFCTPAAKPRPAAGE